MTTSGPSGRAGRDRDVDGGDGASYDRAGMAMNFVFILIDDMGWTDTSCYGSGFYETPRIDALASGGMSFAGAYAACPVCSPTRASILTGKYPARLGLTNYVGHGNCARGRLIDAPYVDHLSAEEWNLARCLKDAGYQTWHVGKWHLGARDYWPRQQGFDVNIGGCDWGMPRHGYFSPWGLETLPDGPKGEYLTDRLTEEAIRLIEQADSRPYFLYMSHYAVHIPIQCTRELQDKYVEKARQMGLDGAKTFEDGELLPTEHQGGRRVRRRLIQSDPAYAAMLENLDWNVGRLLDAVVASGRGDDTVVFFTSDNGGLATAEGSPTCNAPLSEGKGWMYEGGTREPLLVQAPGITEPGGRCGIPVTSTDFYPTILELAGLPAQPQQHCDGESFVHLLRGGERERTRPLFWHYPHYGNQGGTPGSSIRDGRYKLIEFFEDRRVELYDLESDLSEEHDLARQEKDVADDLRARLGEWREAVGARIPEPNPDWCD
jgi:arylsulfatase A-like enzyme